MFSKLLSRSTRSFAQPAVIPESLPLGIAIEEELLSSYSHNSFYHPHPGEVLNGRFALKAKIGWGSTSTVWLAKDVRWRSTLSPYVAIKIGSSAYYDETANEHELEISQYIARAEKDALGHHHHVRTATDHFNIQGPNGSHLGLVFEPMREPIWMLRRRLGADKATRQFLPFFKTYIKVLLDGLDYLHKQCHIIHTDLKLDNILMTFEDRSVIDDFITRTTLEPMHRKVLPDHTVYLSHNNFGGLKRLKGTPALLKIWPKITDFGLAQRGDKQEPLIHPIQVNHCRAPEVLLGIGWSYSADIWNFGVMVWDLLAGEELFQKLRDKDGKYSAQHHLAEMIALVGPIPPALVRRERSMRHWRWAPEAVNSRGQLCNNAADFYGGPFLDDNGTFVANDLIPFERRMKAMVPECIADREVDIFLNFMRKMLCWLPEQRATAAELRHHPWLADDND